MKHQTDYTTENKVYRITNIVDKHTGRPKLERLGRLVSVCTMSKGVRGMFPYEDKELQNYALYTSNITSINIDTEQDIIVFVTENTIYTLE